MLTRLKMIDLLPVGLSEVKAHLRLDHAHEDEYLRIIIQAAVGFVEEYLGRSLLTQTWRIVWEKKGSCSSQLSTSADDLSIVKLPYPPLRAILSVNRLLTTGDKQPIRRHRLDLNHQMPRLIFADVHDSVEIDYETGYGDRPTDIPPVIRQAILMSAADFYEIRDSGTAHGNQQVRELLDSYRIAKLS